MIPKELTRMKPLQPGERLGMNRDSEYLGAEDIDPGSEPIVTIDAIYSGMVTLQRGKEMKDVLTFREDRVPGIRNVRPLIVNATNRKTLRKLFGSVNVEKLVGQSIQLYVDPNVRDPSSGERTDGIRIRPRKPQQAAKAEPIICTDCGKEIVGVGRFTPEIIAHGTMQKYGARLCSDCGKKRAAAMESEAVKEQEQTEQPQTEPNENKEG